MAAIALVATGWWFTPAPVNWIVTIDPDFEGGVDAWVRNREELADRAWGLVPGTEARIRWQQPGIRTEYAVVYVHGFSASRQEIAPVPERVADALGANLYEMRLKGHGHESEPMFNVSAEGWIAETAVAISIGKAIGDRIVLISTSTGGTLTLALLDHPQMARVDSIVMISPNVEPADPRAKWLTRPFGIALGYAVTGGTRTWTARNERQERYWTTSYPIAASIEVMRLVDYVQTQTPASIEQNMIVFMSADDTVVSPQAAREAFNAIDAPRKRWVDVPVSGDSSNHVLAGDVLSPGNTDSVVETIVEFIGGANSRPAP